MALPTPFLRLLVFTGLFMGLLSWWLARRITTKTHKEPLPSEGQRKKTAKVDLTHVDVAGIKPTFTEWTSKPQIPYRPWHDGPYHVTMGECDQGLIPEKSANLVVSGLKNMQVRDWIEIDDTYLEKYHLKKSLYREHRDEVLVVQPGCEDALFESVHYLKEVLCRGYPQMFKLQSPDVIENRVTGDVWNLARDAETWNTYHPLEVMGLLATEDFFILQTDPNTGISTLKAAGSCFPAGFKIEERVGCSLWEIHAGKVPRYEQNLAKSMDRFFQKLRVDSPIQRFNYAIDDSGELFHRHSHHNLGDTGFINKPKLGDLHLRVERQALQRLPESRDLLFSIRTYVTPIHEVTKDTDVARALRTSVNSYSEDVARYKNKLLWNDVLQEHISSVLGETEAMKSCEGESS